MKSRIEGLYDKIIIIIVPSYTRKISLVFSFPLALLLMLCTHNNEDGNKLVIPGIALYCGDAYIVIIIIIKYLMIEN